MQSRCLPPAICLLRYSLDDTPRTNLAQRAGEPRGTFPARIVATPNGVSNQPGCECQQVRLALILNKLIHRRNHVCGFFSIDKTSFGDDDGQTAPEDVARDRIVTAITKETIVGWVARIEIAVVVNRHSHLIHQVEAFQAFEFFERGLKENEIGIISLRRHRRKTRGSSIRRDDLGGLNPVRDKLLRRR